MHIEKYWGNYIGGSDDSLNLLEYLADKDKDEISLAEIFADLGLDKQEWDFRQSAELGFVTLDGLECEFYYAIDLIIDISALLLECYKSGNVSIGELLGDAGSSISITWTDDEKVSMNEALQDFIQNPMEYDLQEMMDEEEIQEMAQECEELRKELFG